MRLHEREPPVARHALPGPIRHANPLNQGYMINSTGILGDKGVILSAAADIDTTF